MGLIGLIALLWTSLLLAASYFVLLTLDKAKGGVNAFGKAVAAVLIIVAIVVCATGIYVLVTGNCPLLPACPMMGGKYGMMGKGMMGQGMMGKGMMQRGMMRGDMMKECPMPYPMTENEGKMKPGAGSDIRPQ